MLLNLLVSSFGFSAAGTATLAAFCSPSLVENTQISEDIPGNREILVLIAQVVIAGWETSLTAARQESVQPGRGYAGDGSSLIPHQCVVVRDSG
jgi:hypothetical protein